MIGIPNPWKFSTIGLGVLSFGLTVYCGLLKYENVGLREAFNDCKLNLITAQDNEKRLEAQITDQNDAITAFGAASGARTAAAAAALAKAVKDSRAAQDRAAVLLGGGVDGSTLEQRVRAVDAKVMEGLK